jgi:hypothetical protein
LWGSWEPLADDFCKPVFGNTVTEGFRQMRESLSSPSSDASIDTTLPSKRGSSGKYSQCGWSR